MSTAAREIGVGICRLSRYGLGRQTRHDVFCEINSCISDGTALAGSNSPRLQGACQCPMTLHDIIQSLMLLGLFPKWNIFFSFFIFLGGGYLPPTVSRSAFLSLVSTPVLFFNYNLKTLFRLF